MACPECLSVAEAGRGAWGWQGKGDGGGREVPGGGQGGGGVQVIDMDLLHQLESCVELNALACCAIYGRQGERHWELKRLKMSLE